MDERNRKCFTIDSLLNRPDPVKTKNAASPRLYGDMGLGFPRLPHVPIPNPEETGWRLRAPYHRKGSKRQLPHIDGGSSEGDDSKSKRCILGRTSVYSRYQDALDGAFQWCEQFAPISHFEERVKQKRGEISSTTCTPERRMPASTCVMGNVYNGAYNPPSWMSDRFRVGNGRVPVSTARDLGALRGWFPPREVPSEGSDRTDARGIAPRGLFSREVLSGGRDRGSDDSFGSGEDEDSVGGEECVSRGGISISLQRSNLWREFHERGTEMIINRHGRRMFPRLSIQVSGLDPEASYNVSLGFSKVDGRRFKFVNGEWYSTQIMGGQGEESRRYLHPDSPKSGDIWMSDAISFSKLKITNSDDLDESKVFLQSMFKYAPHIIIGEAGTGTEDEPAPAGGPPGRVVCDVTFPVTDFIAVTAYQNERITHLKIKNNPFAKAFREPARDEYRYFDRTPSLLTPSYPHPSDGAGYNWIPASFPAAVCVEDVQLETARRDWGPRGSSESSWGS